MSACVRGCMHVCVRACVCISHFSSSSFFLVYLVISISFMLLSFIVSLIYWCIIVVYASCNQKYMYYADTDQHIPCVNDIDWTNTSSRYV